MALLRAECPRHHDQLLLPESGVEVYDFLHIRHPALLNDLVEVPENERSLVSALALHQVLVDEEKDSLLRLFFIVIFTDPEGPGVNGKEKLDVPRLSCLSEGHLVHHVGRPVGSDLAVQTPLIVLWDVFPVAQEVEAGELCQAVLREYLLESVCFILKAILWGDFQQEVDAYQIKQCLMPKNRLVLKALQDPVHALLEVPPSMQKGVNGIHLEDRLLAVLQVYLLVQEFLGHLLDRGAELKQL